MRVSGIKGGAPRASLLPQDMLYTFSGRCILSAGQGELLLHAWYKLRLRDEYSSPIYIRSISQRELKWKFWTETAERRREPKQPSGAQASVVLL